MRLIDADALRASAIKATGNTELAFDNCFPYWQFSKCIKEAPTIEAAPVIHAEWKTNSNYPDKLICSVCGYKEDMWWADNGTYYCPNCGAKMEVRNE